MPRKRRSKLTKVKTRPEDIVDLTLKSYQYSKFREMDESEETPERRSVPSALKGGYTLPEVLMDERPFIPEIDPSLLFNNTHKFVPGRTKF